MRNTGELPELLKSGIKANISPCLELGRRHYIYQLHEKGATALRPLFRERNPVSCNEIPGGDRAGQKRRKYPHMGVADHNSDLYHQHLVDLKNKQCAANRGGCLEEVASPPILLPAYWRQRQQSRLNLRRLGCGFDVENLTET